MLRRIRKVARKRSLTVEVIPGKGSHRKVRVGRCQTTIPFHGGEDLGQGLRDAIEEDLEPCLGKRWSR